MKTNKLLSVFLIMILAACMLFSVSAFATYPPIYVSGDDTSGGNPPAIISGSDAGSSGSASSSYPSPVQTPVVVQPPSSGSGPKLVGGPLDGSSARGSYIYQTDSGICHSVIMSLQPMMSRLPPAFPAELSVVALF